MPPEFEPVGDLSERLRRATEAAEDLASAALGADARVAGPPPAGWQAPEAAREPDPNVQALATLLETARSLAPEVPRELGQQLASALRELLLALRALIDWYLARSERRAPEPAEVQDIPIL